MDGQRSKTISKDHNFRITEFGNIWGHHVCKSTKRCHFYANKLFGRYAKKSLSYIIVTNKNASSLPDTTRTLTGTGCCGQTKQKWSSLTPSAQGGFGVEIKIATEKSTIHQAGCQVLIPKMVASATTFFFILPPFLSRSVASGDLPPGEHMVR